MPDSVAPDALVQGLAPDTVAMHRPDLVSDVVVYYVMDTAAVKTSERGTRRPTASRSHFK